MTAPAPSNQEQQQQQQQSTPSQGNPQQQQQTAPPQPQTSHNGYGPGQQILDALNALPERIVNGMREAMQPPKVPSGTQQQNQGSETSSSATDTKGQQKNPADSGQSATAGQGSSKQDKSSHTEPGKKSFAQWWFGG